MPKMKSNGDEETITNSAAASVLIVPAQKPAEESGLVTATKGEWNLQFSNVCYTVKQCNGTVKPILRQVFGEFKSNRLTAILGSSGAGKTSMLNVLSGFKASGVTGQILLNEEERNLVNFRTLCSYIPQEFAMLELLTVEETLHCSTDLKLPTETTSGEKVKIINDILKILNMENCRHTLVRNLSGGERKRLSIGIELVTNPPIFFFDEPISGLDSVASLQIITYLRRLAKDGRIIVISIHQPSSKLMSLFDDVLVMSRGEVLYSGSQEEMIDGFQQAGFTCPHFYNPADFVLEVGSEEENNNTIRLIEMNKQKFMKCEIGSTRSSYIDEKSEMLPRVPSDTSIDASLEQQLQKTESPAIDVHIVHNGCAVIRPKSQVSLWRQLSVLTRRSIRSMTRNLISVQLRVVMHIVVGFLLGIVFWNIGDDASKVLTNSSCIFFLILFVFFANAMPSILLCPQDTKVFMRECYLNGWYSMKAYYFAKVIADIPMQIICPTLFITIAYFMTGQPPDWNRFVMCWIISLLTGMIGHFFGLVFGSTFGMQMSVFLVPSISIPLLIFSGYFIRIHELSSFLRPLCDISFFRYTMEGFLQAIYGYDRSNLECFVDFCYYKSPKKFLKEMDMLGDRYGTDICACCIWIIVFKVLFFLSLLWRMKRTQ